MKSKINPINRHILAAYIFGATLCTGALAQSEETVFGFTLGKHIDAPECTYRIIGGKKFYDLISSYTCAWGEEKQSNEPFSHRTIILAKDNAPGFMKGIFKAYIKDGLFIGASFATFGIHSQDEAFAQLTLKYGEPQTILKSKTQNLAGANFDSISAKWLKNEVSVTFNGVTDKIDLGEVNIETRIMSEIKLQRLNDKLKSEIKL